MARNMIVWSTFYFVIGVVMGMVMSISEVHTLSPVHAHINLLGWVSMALGGILYHLFPAAANSMLGKWHFWLHVIGIPLMMAGLAGLLSSGNSQFIIATSIGGICVVIGAIFLFINAARYVK
ncbi:cytochrome-c oxidase [Paenibacillus qinlingensis]|uniref:cytochrome-c oxidase n=1 Tax=Paenibacillus qinlingensis TaxID=1837343 RepID=UPI001567240B|nr:cytochrome-c oxidase [Paenibacillus qinlingensis]NQX62603.1 cytochrome-c oxidase [Paenibacillus qinlingensis]